jgi:adenosylcobyric acid synthase
MMLGSDIIDHSSVEGSAHGLGILPLQTTFDPIKVTRPATVRFPTMPRPFSKLGGVLSSGYEIRNGGISGEACELSPLLWGKGSVLATTVHGLLENPQVLGALCGCEPEPVLERTFEALADAVDEHLDTVFLRTLVGLAPSP